MAVLDRQIKEGLNGITGSEAAGIIVAYEPVWAIGTGKNATPAEAGEAHQHIRDRLRAWLGAEAADRCRIQYGGSVKPDNVEALIALPDIDGALIGGASLQVESFHAIITKAAARPGA
jgi:triosephosphate isomerase